MVTTITSALAQYLLNVLTDIPLAAAELVTTTLGVHSPPVAYLAGIATTAVVVVLTTLITGLTTHRSSEYGTDHHATGGGRIATDSPINTSDTTQDGISITRTDE